MGNISSLVGIYPGVLGVGGSNLVQNGLVLTESTRVPVGTVASFPTVAAVGAFFGTASPEALSAPYYFNGYDQKTAAPGALLFAQFPYAAPVGAYLQSGKISSTALTVFQGISSGSLDITIDGVALVASSINLSAITSYSNIATAVQTALQTAASSTTGASVTGTIATTVLTVTAVASGTLVPGMVLTGTGVTAGTTVVTQLTGTTGGVGTYTITPSQTEATSETITAHIAPPTCTFDSTSGCLFINSGSTGIYSTITAATGTSISTTLLLSPTTLTATSPGAAQVTNATIASALSAILAINNDWTGLTYGFEPVLADKVTIAQWVNNQNFEIWFSMWDSGQAYLQTDDTTSAGYQIIQAAYNGTLPIGGDLSYCTATQIKYAGWTAAGCVASINFNRANARFRLQGATQAGLIPTISNATYQANSLANGYSFYGQYAGQGTNFNQFTGGAISGEFDWLDSFVNQIWLNNACQIALVQCGQSEGNFPYNAQGYSKIAHYLYNGSALQSNPNTPAGTGPIGAALNFGAINTGINLSASQISALQSAGVTISSIVTNGFYIIVADPGPTARNLRQSPIITVYYTDGGQIQTLNLSSIDVQ